MTRTPGRPRAARPRVFVFPVSGRSGAPEAFTLSPDPRKPRHGLVPPSSLARTPVGIARTHETHIANAACAPNGPNFQPRSCEKVGPPDFQKIVKAPTLLLYLRVRWRPLSGISLLTEFGGVRLTVVMTFPERTDVVLGRSRRDFGSVLLVARRMPLGDGVRDDLGRERSHLSKVRITNHLAFNSLPLRLQVVFCLLQLCDQPVERL